MVSPEIPQLDFGLPRHAPPAGAVIQRWLDNDGRVVATEGESNGRWWMHWDGLATYWFATTGCVVAEPVGSASEATIRDVFSRGVVPVVLIARGFEALHAGAVLHSRGVLALCGNSGTGKSTIALALAARALTHFADDTLVYSLEDGRPVAVALPFPVRVDPAARMAASITTGVTPSVAGSRSSVRAVYCLIRDPQLPPREPWIVEVPVEKRFEQLLAHAHSFEMGAPERRRRFFENLLELARAAGMYECRFAPALHALPALAQAIDEHAANH